MNHYKDVLAINSKSKFLMMKPKKMNPEALKRQLQNTLSLRPTKIARNLGQKNKNLIEQNLEEDKFDTPLNCGNHPSDIKILIHYSQMDECDMTL